MLRIGLYFLGGLAGLILIIALAGATLPTSHVATRSARYAQPPQKVWEEMLRLPPVDPAVEYTVELEIPPTRRITRIVIEDLPYGGTWTWDISPHGEGSIARITENGEIYNPLLRFLARYVFGYTSTMDKQLKELGTRLGETVQIED